MQTLRSRGAPGSHHPCGSGLSHSSRRPGVSRTAGLSRGSGGSRDSLLSSLSLLPGTSLRSGGSHVTAASLGSVWTRNSSLTRQTNQSSWALVAGRALGANLAWGTLGPSLASLASLAGTSHHTRGSSLARKSPGSSLALIAHHAWRSLHARCSIPARLSILAWRPRHSLESSGAGRANHSSLPGWSRLARRSGLPR